MQNSEKSDLETISLIVEMRRNNEDEEKPWELIRDLHRSGSPDVCKRCIAMCKSDDSIERRSAADILGCLGWRNCELPFRDLSIPSLTRLLKDPNEKVIDAAISALGHMRAEVEILAHIKLTEHESDLVRFSMACCLGLLDSAKARRALIKLSADEDTEVRNWATFGLGTQCDNNTKEIRAALFNRLSDDDDETRNEAILGLARRKIRDVLSALIQELEEEPENPSPLAIEAAAELLSRELLEPLRKVLKATGDSNGTVKDVIEQIEKSCV